MRSTLATAPNARRHARAGFSLIELVIVIVIIGIIAAIAIPRVTRGADRAGENATKSSLALVRNAIEMFRSEHGGVAPTYAEFTNTTGTSLVAQHTFQGQQVGPYLQAMPAVRIGANQNSNVRDDADATREVTGTEGWAYQASTGVFYANVGTGTSWSGNAFDW